MKLLMKLVIIFLILIIAYSFLYYFSVYNDTVSSAFKGKNLKGKIVYSLGGYCIKTIELPSQRNTVIYSKHGLDEDVGLIENPYFSPDGTMVIFSQSRSLFKDELYVMNSDGSNANLFLHMDNEISALCPSWSPDGTKIAFIVQNTGREGLYIIDRHSHNITNICNIRPSKDQPAWSPDNKKIAFSSENIVSKNLGNGLREERNMGGIYIIDIATGNIENYIDLADQPAWSPNGTTLAFERGDGYHVIDVFDKIGQTDNLIIPYRKAVIGIGGSFPIRWSPDGKYLVFCKELWYGIAGIYIAPIDKPRSQIRIATDDQSIIGMSWTK